MEKEEKKHPRKKNLPTIVVMIPAYNEEKSIVEVIKSIPRRINNHQTKILVINDGSTDNTEKVSKSAGADFVISNNTNRGLAFTFQKGLNHALRLGADIIVNTDADNQYNQAEIEKLVKPILEGKADIVSGDRQVDKLDHMVASKKYGNIIGTKVVQFGAGYKIKDASSGFRAYSREAALKLLVLSDHTYTHETLIQASHKKLKVVEVPVEFRRRDGKSKLISSVYNHVKKSGSTIVRNTLMYNSLKFFSYLGLFLIIVGMVPMIRFFYLSYVLEEAGQHIQSLILGLLLILSGGMSILLGFLADIIAINRRHLEEILYLVRKREFGD